LTAFLGGNFVRSPTRRCYAARPLGDLFYPSSSYYDNGRHPPSPLAAAEPYCRFRPLFFNPDLSPGCPVRPGGTLVHVMIHAPCTFSFPQEQVFVSFFGMGVLLASCPTLGSGRVSFLLIQIRVCTLCAALVPFISLVRCFFLLRSVVCRFIVLHSVPVHGFLSFLPVLFLFLAAIENQNSLPIRTPCAAPSYPV